VAPSFDELVRFLRAETGCRAQIAPEQRIEQDLHLCGDDAVDLLQAVERRFAVLLHDQDTGYRRTFGMPDDEVLFSGEGWPLPGVSWLSRRMASPQPRVRDLTMSELHSAIVRASRP
jgi:hypothetical protein